MLLASHTPFFSELVTSTVMKEKWSKGRDRGRNRKVGLGSAAGRPPLAVRPWASLGRPTSLGSPGPWRQGMQSALLGVGRIRDEVGQHLAHLRGSYVIVFNHCQTKREMKG